MTNLTAQSWLFLKECGSYVCRGITVGGEKELDGEQTRQANRGYHAPANSFDLNETDSLHHNLFFSSSTSFWTKVFHSSQHDQKTTTSNEYSKGLFAQLQLEKRWREPKTLYFLNKWKEIMWPWSSENWFFNKICSKIIEEVEILHKNRSGYTIFVRVCL